MPEDNILERKHSEEEMESSEHKNSTEENTVETTTSGSNSAPYIQQKSLSNLSSTPFSSYQTISPEVFESSRPQNPQLSQVQENQNQPRQTRILEKITSEGNQMSNSIPSNSEQFSLIYERETRWNEVRKYSELIRRFTGEVTPQQEISKENFYDLYHMAISLLKSVDSLDPDKANQRKTTEFDFNMPTSQLSINPSIFPGTLSDVDGNQGRKPMDYLPYRSPYDPTPGVLYNTPTLNPNYVSQFGSLFPYPSLAKAEALKVPKNYTGEVFFDDLGQPDESKRTKRRRRRTMYSSRRNLHCHMCGVTETPEWRRGPAGDHTLCNACGLHYAKSLKKQRKEREAVQTTS